jgi:serine/threonine-protein kinase
VPPPSNFNRRVTPELDAISLKALARDVADRYQSAAQLAQDLDALIAGYRFDPKELRQFIRQLFRREYAKELEETEMALAAEPGLSFAMPFAGRAPTGQITETPTDTMPSVKIEVPPDAPPPVDESGNNGGKPRGFWGSLFKRKK